MTWDTDVSDFSAYAATTSLMATGSRMDTSTAAPLLLGLRPRRPAVLAGVLFFLGLGMIAV